ncbi:MAG: hypothetical protein SFU91_12025 [Chloroherpetonaceae bacterium]|nr:hypothetical protein [Chloroherpetonaceae bacterium]
MPHLKINRCFPSISLFILLLISACSEKKTTQGQQASSVTPDSAQPTFAAGIDTTHQFDPAIDSLFNLSPAVFPAQFVIHTETSSPSESILIQRGETIAISRLSDALHSLTDSLNLLLSLSLSPSDTALFRNAMRPINQVIYSRVPNPNAFPDSIFYLNIVPQPVINLIKSSQKEAPNGRTLYTAEFEARMSFASFSKVYLERLKKFPEYYNLLKAHPIIRGLENSLGSVS